MNDWQERVIEERNQLSERLRKLTVFLENNLIPNGNNRFLLIQQQRTMELYLDILEERVNRFADFC